MAEPVHGGPFMIRDASGDRSRHEDLDSPLPSGTSWDDVWRVAETIVPSLNVIARAAGLEDGVDLVHAFVLERLPRIVPITARMPEGEAHLYLRASFRNFLRDAYRAKNRQERALEILRSEAQSAAPDDGSTLPPNTVAEALSDLPATLARAAALFLGTDEAPKSLRDIAAILGITRYEARTAVLDGLLAIAARLGERGVLTRKQLECCRLVLLEGVPIGEAAQQMHLTHGQVVSALDQARMSVAIVLNRKQSNSGEALP
jgi:DNA-directed RNA polymerase specialized sigma24 family protein